MITIEPKVLEALARKFSPVLRFHEQERFFPLLVESWLTHTSDGVWPEHSDRAVRLRTSPADPSRRGAAILTADRAMTALKVLAGPPVDGSRPLDLGVDPANTYSLASSLIRKLDSEAFLDVGGWAAPPRLRPNRASFEEGDLEHLASLCSELASAMSPQVPWSPPQDRATAPWPWVAQPPQPTLYCEITWAGAYPRIASQYGATEFPEGERSLDQMVAFTYHLFYAAREAPAAAEGARNSEGQWEAITLFFPAEISRDDKDQGHLVRSGSIAEEPQVVVISQGQDRHIDAHFTALDDYRACELSGTHPVIYVARGTHRNYFHPVDGDTFDPGAHGPHGPDTTTHDDEDGSWIGIDGFLATAGVLLGVAALVGIAIAIIVASVVVLAGLALVAVVALVILAALLVIAAIILFILWIISACDESSDKDAGEDVSPAPEPDESGSGSGPQSGGDGSEDPSGSGPGPGSSPSGSTGGGTSGGGGTTGGGVTGTVGLPNTGSPTGRETVFPDIRFVERLLVGGASAAHTTFPTDQEMENPVWWDYRGRWGVRVKNRPGSGTWESGWQRIDRQDRDWGYFAAERWLLVRNGGPRQS